MRARPTRTASHRGKPSAADVHTRTAAPPCLPTHSRGSPLIGTALSGPWSPAASPRCATAPGKRPCETAPRSQVARAAEPDVAGTLSGSRRQLKPARPRRPRSRAEARSARLRRRRSLPRGCAAEARSTGSRWRGSPHRVALARLTPPVGAWPGSRRQAAPVRLAPSGHAAKAHTVRHSPIGAHDRRTVPPTCPVVARSAGTRRRGWLHHIAPAEANATRPCHRDSLHQIALPV